MTHLTWLELNDKLPAMTEQEVLRLLETEKRHARRSTVLIRLHQRYCVLRMMRERAEIEEIINDTTGPT